MSSVKAKLSVMVGGLKPTGLGSYITVADPAGIYFLNNSPGVVSYPWVYRRQDDTWDRLPDALGVNRYFETEDPVASANWELLEKTQYIAGKGNLNLVSIWKLVGATYNAPYNEWDLGDLVTQLLPSGHTMRITVPKALTQDAILKAQWMNQWNIRALQIANENGLKLSLLSSATGGPSFDLLPYLYEGLALAKQGQHIIDLHEYGVEGALQTSPSSGALRCVDLYGRLPAECRCEIVISEFWWGNGVESGGNQSAQLADAKWYGEQLHQYTFVKWASFFQLNEAGENNMPVDMLVNYASIAADVALSAGEPIEPPTDAVSADGDFGGIDVIVDANKTHWELDTDPTHRKDPGYDVLKEGIPFAGGIGVALLYYNSQVYVTNRFAQWFRVTATGYESISGDPRLTGPDPSPGDFWCIWPIKSTEAPNITNPFNAPRDYANHLHEGLDGDAYDNSTGQKAQVLAAQDGIVEYVVWRTDTPSYGTHIVIRHPWGTEPNRFRTLYGHLSSVFVTVGQTVKRGDVIGVAGASGTSAIHLHFNVHDAVKGLKGYVRCSDCSGHWPDGVVNPQPLIHFDSTPPPTNVGQVAIQSVHGRADGGEIRSVDLQAAMTAKLNGYKCFQNPPSTYANLIANGFSAANILVRLSHVTDRRVTAAEYVNGSTGYYDLPIQEALKANIKWFELFNEPNRVEEGLGVAWTDVTDFSSLFKSLVIQIRQFYPVARVLSPALSQSPEAWWAAFQTQSVFAISDGLAEHCYWDRDNPQASYPMDSEIGGRRYRKLFPYLTTGKKIHLTEVSNNQTFVSDVEKGQEYAKYLMTMETDKVARVDIFCISASDVTFNSRRETWVRGSSVSAIPGEVAKRQ